MTATISERDGRVLVNLLGDIDLEHSGDIRQVLLDCVGRGADVLVDMSQVLYIDSSGIACLIEALQSSRERGSGFGLVSVSEQAGRVLKLARLDKVFEIHNDMGAAFAGAA
jgi:anti-sigma B factor antagonist